MKVRIVAILLFIGLAFLFSGCHGSDSTSGEIIPLEGFHPSTIDTINWMSKLDDNRKLSEIVLPGSHDSGMAICENCSKVTFVLPIPISVEIWTKTQKWDIEHQLHAGSRYFDIRLEYRSGELLRTYHRSNSFGQDGVGCDGETFPYLMAGAVRFLKEHPTEFVIFKFSHWRDNPGRGYFPAEAMYVLNENLTTWEKFYESVTKPDPTDPDSKGRELLYKKDVLINSNILETPVSELRGKIVAVFHNFVNESGSPPIAYYNPSTGRFFYSDVGKQPVGEWTNFNFPVYDEYSNTPFYADMKNDQLYKLRYIGGLKKEFLFVLSWILTPGFPELVAVSDLAHIANTNLPSVLYDNSLEKLPLPNIVLIDFVDVGINQEIIQYNEDVRTW